MRVTIRSAELSDVEWLITQLREFSQFFQSKRPLFGDVNHAVKVITDMVMQHLCIISEDDTGTRSGFIAGYVMPHPFNPEIKTLTETFWWVDEAHRGSRAGLMLLNAFVGWGEKNVDWINIGIESNSPVSDRSLLKRGFKVAEKYFLKEID